MLQSYSTKMGNISSIPAFFTLSPVSKHWPNLLAHYALMPKIPPNWGQQRFSIYAILPLKEGDAFAKGVGSACFLAIVASILAGAGFADSIFPKLLIGLTQHIGKLVFVRLFWERFKKHCKGGIHASRQGKVPVFRAFWRKRTAYPGGMNASPTVKTKGVRKSTNSNTGYRLRTASMETPHVTTVGAAISRPKGLNHCAFPAKRGALEAVRFRAADSRPYGGTPASDCWMVCCFNPIT